MYSTFLGPEMGCLAAIASRQLALLIGFQLAIFALSMNSAREKIAPSI